MTTKSVTVINPNTGEPMVFAIETDPDYIPEKEYQDEDGNWFPAEEEEE